MRLAQNRYLVTVSSNQAGYRIGHFEFWRDRDRKPCGRLDGCH